VKSIKKCKSLLKVVVTAMASPPAARDALKPP